MSRDGRPAAWSIGGEREACPHPGEELDYLGDGDLAAFFECARCGAAVVARLDDLPDG